ncbi:hypothetical protein GN956_G14807 [Arapaima gigas]
MEWKKQSSSSEQEALQRHQRPSSRLTSQIHAIRPFIKAPPDVPNQHRHTPKAQAQQRNVKGPEWPQNFLRLEGAEPPAGSRMRPGWEEAAERTQNPLKRPNTT